jgi:drug/metabolite transporter (DMT)-like permease
MPEAVPAAAVRRSDKMAWAMLVAMGAAWGLSFSLARVVAVGGVHPVALTFWEASLAGLMLAVYAGLRRLRFGRSRQHMAMYLVTGLLGMAIPGLGFFYAAAHVSAGVLSISVAIVPIVTFISACVLRIEKPEVRRVAGLVLGVAAIALLVGSRGGLGGGDAIWIVIAVVTSSSYAALSLVLTLWKPEGGGTPTAACGMFLIGALLVSPMAWSAGIFSALSWPWTAVEWSLLGLGLINAFAYAVWFRLIERAGPVFASQTANVITFFGVAWAFALFGESQSAGVWLSFATMMLALALVRPRGEATGG